MFRLVILLLLIFNFTYSYSNSKRSKYIISKIFKLYQQGEYEKVLSTISKVKKSLSRGNNNSYRELNGLLHYWSGKTNTKLNEYEKAEFHFKKSLKLKFIARDLYYEYGQVLYTQDKYVKARIAFKESVKRKYKEAVSLYYIGFISQELKDYKKAAKFYQLIESLKDEEKSDVIQAARMQVADMYLERVENMPEAYSGVEKYVIPKYKSALEWDKNSRLADDIRVKILQLQRKYELVLFKMRNGRNTAQPPYFLRASVLYGIDDNVNRQSVSSLENLNTEDYSSTYNTTSFFSRYSFYPNSSYSIAPEFSGAYTSYSSTSSDIIVNNNYFLRSALKTNFEHIYNDSPATLYLDIDYTFNADDSDADGELSYSSTAVGFTISEELQLWRDNPSTFRYGYVSNMAEDTDLSTTSHILTYEQLILFKRFTIFSFNSFDMTKFREETLDNLDSNTFTARVDLIFPTLFNLFNPTIYASYTSTNYINDNARGILGQNTFGFNLNRPVGNKLYLTVDFSSSKQDSSIESDNFTQTLTTFNLEYIY